MTDPIVAELKDPASYGRSLAERKAWIFHAATMALGPAEKFFSGEEGDRHVSDVNGEEVLGPVLVLATGHALVLVPAQVIELEDREAAYVQLAQHELTSLLAKVLTTAKESGMADRTAALLTIAILRAQCAAFEASDPGPEQAMG
jgi:hypothetical protein